MQSQVDTTRQHLNQTHAAEQLYANMSQVLENAINVSTEATKQLSETMFSMPSIIAEAAGTLLTPRSDDAAEDAWCETSVTATAASGIMTMSYIMSNSPKLSSTIGAAAGVGVHSMISPMVCFPVRGFRRAMDYTFAPRIFRWAYDQMWIVAPKQDSAPSSL